MPNETKLGMEEALALERLPSIRELHGI